MELTRQEQRSYVKIAVLRGRNVKSLRTVARYAAAFQRGKVASADMRRTGRPRTVRTHVVSAVVAQCLKDDRRWSLLELEAHTCIDQATVHKNLTRRSAYA